MRKLNPAVYAKHKWLSGCVEQNALLGLLVNHIIIPSPSPNISKYHEPPLNNINYNPDAATGYQWVTKLNNQNN
jgi:hypothetical protein